VIANAKPNASHFALAQAESLGRISHIITQNVDSLHQQAGSKKVTELHGRLDKVICMTCRALIYRLRMDDLIEDLNPAIRKDLSVEFTPDGDAEVEAASDFRIPPCPGCGGILKPDVVFFVESVPSERVASTMEQLERAEALLVAGSSLTVNSGMRFARAANKAGKPIVIVNVGPTKADEIALAKIEAPTSVALEELLID
jgi:NAD-dependent SIR2 family protein deacetylase